MPDRPVMSWAHALLGVPALADKSGRCPRGTSRINTGLHFARDHVAQYEPGTNLAPDVCFRHCRELCLGNPFQHDVRCAKPTSSVGGRPRLATRSSGPPGSAPLRCFAIARLAQRAYRFGRACLVARYGRPKLSGVRRGPDPGRRASAPAAGTGFTRFDIRRRCCRLRQRAWISELRAWSGFFAFSDSIECGAARMRAFTDWTTEPFAIESASPHASGHSSTLEQTSISSRSRCATGSVRQDSSSSIFAPTRSAPAISTVTMTLGQIPGTIRIPLDIAARRDKDISKSSDEPRSAHRHPRTRSAQPTVLYGKFRGRYRADLACACVTPVFAICKPMTAGGRNGRSLLISRGRVCRESPHPVLARVCSSVSAR